jgi:hypothetical protein
MEKRLDRLFKDKLQNNQLLPHHNAWIRINEQLQVSRRMIWRRRLAMARLVPATDISRGRSVPLRTKLEPYGRCCRTF